MRGGPYTTREVGEFLIGAGSEWKVRRLYEHGDLPEPPRFGGKRAISSEDIPAIVEALRARGWLSQAEHVSASDA